MTRVAVPQYITVEDKLLGLITFKQLFAFLGSFFLTYIMFQINTFLGFITFVLSFGLTAGLTFVKVNNQPFYKILPSVIKLFLENKSFKWKMEKGVKQEVVFVVEKPFVTQAETIPERKIPRYVPPAEQEQIKPKLEIKPQIEIKFNQPLQTQFKQPEPPKHKHEHDPNNPYRLFPYVKISKVK